MPISTEKTLVIYNSGEPASLDYMTEYIKIRRIPTSNLYGIDTPTSDRYISYQDFESNLLNPIKNILQNNSYNCIVLGYRIPSGFLYNNRVYSVSSVISIINQQFDGIPKPNPFYNISDKSKYDSKLGKSIHVCFNIDAINTIQIKNYLNRIKLYRNNFDINGSFYLDTFHNKNSYPNDSIYSDIANSFYSNGKKLFNIDIRKTTNNTNSIEPCFSLLLNDSIFWGWGDLIANDSYFLPSNKNRFVFMSYDNRSLSSLRSDASDNACMSALNKGYACVAGNIGDGAFTEQEIAESLVGDVYDPYYIPVISNHVVPDPFVFMESISSGRALGDAFLFSKPYFHDSFVVIGDPHLKGSVSTEKVQEDINAIELWRKVEYNLSQTAGYIFGESNIATLLYERCVRGNDLDMKTTLANVGFNLNQKYFIENRKSEFSKTFESFQLFSQQINFQIHSYDDIIFNNFLQKNNLFVSRSIINMFSNSNAILSDQYFTNIKRNRNIDLIIPIMEMDGDAGYLHFELEASLDSEYNQTIFNFKSYENVSEWLYEQTVGKYEPFTQRGVFSGLVGRKVKINKMIDFKYSLIGKEIYIRYRQVLNGRYYSKYFEMKAMITS